LKKEVRTILEAFETHLFSVKGTHVIKT